jgi:mono/diheme cytochrome c family protein
MLRAVVILAILSAAGAASAAAQDAKAQGERVFADQKCVLCHSIGGKGNSKGLLDEVGSELSEFTLPKEDVDALVAYLSAMKKK